MPAKSNNLMSPQAIIINVFLKYCNSNFSEQPHNTPSQPFQIHEWHAKNVQNLTHTASSFKASMILSFLILPVLSSIVSPTTAKTAAITAAYISQLIRKE